jgi:hypothetical protein
MLNGPALFSEEGSERISDPTLEPSVGFSCENSRRQGARPRCFLAPMTTVDTSVMSEIAPTIF